MWFHFGDLRTAAYHRPEHEGLADSSVLRCTFLARLFDEDVVRDFRRQSGHKVRCDGYSPTDDLWNKISTNQGKDFDVLPLILQNYNVT